MQFDIRVDIETGNVWLQGNDQSLYPHMPKSKLGSQRYHTEIPDKENHICLVQFKFDTSECLETVIFHLIFKGQPRGLSMFTSHDNYNIEERIRLKQSQEQWMIELFDQPHEQMLRFGVQSYNYTFSWGKVEVLNSIKKQLLGANFIIIDYNKSQA
jgi:hypothetical protein